MNQLARFATVFAFVSIVSFSVSAQQVTPSAWRATTLKPATSSTISTLYTNDPASHSLCFADGREGHTIQNGGVFNRCSHIEFDHYKAGHLSIGVQGGELGSILDLGTPDDLSKKYGYRETVGKGQGFASIEFRDGKVVIVKDIYKTTRQELKEAAVLFGKGTSGASAEAKAGHIYLARLTDDHNKEFQILVKLLVLSARPGESVTFRWELL